MRQVVGREDKKKTKLVKKRAASWETYVVLGLRPGESDGARKGVGARKMDWLAG